MTANRGGEATAKSGGQPERLEKAKKNFRRIQEEIAPFVRHDQFREFSTAGRWRETSQVAEKTENRASR